MIDPEYQKILDRGRDKHEQIKRQLTHLSKFNTKNFDHVVSDFHNEAFAEVDCMKCGNCCRHLGPLLQKSDIKRVAKEIGIDPIEFQSEQLRQDEEGDWVFKVMPCPFLEEDNSCNVYNKRPGACVDYPHTQERNIQRRLPRLAKNVLFCPAAVLISEKIIKRYSKHSDPDRPGELGEE